MLRGAMNAFNLQNKFCSIHALGVLWQISNCHWKR